MLFLRMLIVAGACGMTAAAQDGPNKTSEGEELAKLQGYWKLEKAEKNSRFDFFLAQYEGIYIENQRFILVRKGLIQRDAETKLLLDPAKTPKELDLADEKATTVPMIYKIQGDLLYLAVHLEDRTAEKKRPGQFSVALKAGADRATHLFICKRVPMVKSAESKLADPKANREELEKAALKDLQGFWVLDKASENGAGDFRAKFTEAIYIENKKVLWVMKNGRVVRNWEADLDLVDPGKKPQEMDFTKIHHSGAGGNADLNMIYKIDGNKMTIALRSDGGPRPRQFTTDLAAGPERATNLFQFSRIVANAPKAPQPKPPQGDRAELEKAALKSLQGFWIPDKLQVNDVSHKFNEFFTGAIYIENKTVMQVQKNGAVSKGWKAQIDVDPTKSPMELDFVKFAPRGDGAVHFICKVEGDKLVIATRSDDVLPRQFTTDLTAGSERATHVVYYTRQTAKKTAEQPQKPPQGDRAELEKAALKSLQGFWVCDKSEINDASGKFGRMMFTEAIYIEKTKVMPALKNGSLTRNWKAQIDVDPTKAPMELAFVNFDPAGPGVADIHAIYKLEGDKLVIAMRSDDLLPRQFTANLTAGSERATHVFCYTRQVAKNTAKQPAPVQGKREDLDKAAVKELQGLWILEKAVENNSENPNGNTFRARFNGGLYIEKKKVIWVEKGGALGKDPLEATLDVDATKSPGELNFLKISPRKGPGNIEELKMIYKIEGDKLTIAVRVGSDDIRPQQFTNHLTAGIERATHVYYFVKKTKE